MAKKHDAKYYQLLSNTILFALGNVGSRFLVFFLMPLYTKKLTTTEYGISELVITGTNLLIPFVSVSIQDSVLRFALDKKNDSGEVLKNSILILSIGSLITCFLYPVIQLYKPISDWAGYFVLISIVYMVRNAFSIYSKSIGRTKLYAIDSVLYTGVLMITNIVFLTTLKLGLEGYFLAIIISSALSIIFLITCGDIFRSSFHAKINTRLLKQMILFSLPMILNNVSWWIINSSDKMMIVHYLSAADSGIYSVASKMPSLLTTVISIFNQAWIISSVTEYDTTKDDAFFSNIFKMFNFVLVFLAAGIVLIIKPFMQIYVGESFTSSWQYVPLLLLGSIFQSYANFFGAIYTSAKKNISVMTTTFFAAGINIVLNLLLIPSIGVQGAVIATAIAYCALFIFRMLDSQKHVKLNIDYFRVIISLLLLTLQCVVTIIDYNAFFVSIICITLLVVFNSESIIRFMIMIKERMCKHKSK